MPAFTETAKLHRAVREGNWQQASSLIEGVTPAKRTLQYAAEHRDQTWNDLLSELGRHRLMSTWTEEEFFYSNVLHGNRKEAETFIARGIVPDEKMLLVAINHLDAAWVKLLADGMAAAKVKLPSEMVLKALYRGEKIATILLEAGAVPDEAVVLKAVAIGSLEILKKLLAAGGPATPTALARAMGFPELRKVKALLEAGAVPEEETVSEVIGNHRDSGWVSMLLDARAAAGHMPTPEMLGAAVRSRNYGGSAALVADDLIKRGVMPDEKTFEYAIRSNDGWAEMLLEAMLAAGRKPTSGMLDAAVQHGRKEFVQKVEEAINDDKKTVSETYNKVAVKNDAPKRVQGTSSRPTPRLVRSPSLKKGL